MHTTRRVAGAAIATLAAIGLAAAAAPADADLPAGAAVLVDADVPADTYLIGNVTAVNNSARPGFVAVSGTSIEGTSTVNTRGGDVRANAFIAMPGDDRAITIGTGGDGTHDVVVDSVAELAANPHTVLLDNPQRVLDTRPSGPTVTADGTIRIPVGGEYAGQLALLNLTIDRPAARGWHATYPCTDGYQGTSAINVTEDGGAHAVLNLVKVDDDGNVCIRSQNGAGGIVVDLLGFIDSDAAPFERKLDTRTSGAPLPPGGERAVVVGPPNSVFVGTVVSTDPSAQGWVAVYTEAGRRNGVSTLNSNGTAPVANAVILKTDRNGAIHLASSPGLSTHIVIDGTIVGELAPFLVSDATRLTDTREPAPYASVELGESDPSGLASDGEFLYVANTNANNVAVVDIATQQVVDTIAVRNSPFYAELAGSTLYVTNGGSNSVSAIDTTSRTVVATIAVGAAPNGLLYDPRSDRVFVTNSESDSVTVIDPDTNRATGTVATTADYAFAEPFQIGSDGERLFVTNGTSDDVTIIDPITERTTGRIEFEPDDAPFGVAFDGRNLNVTIQSGASGVAVIRTSETPQTLGHVALGGSPSPIVSDFGIEADPDDAKLYIGNFAGSLQIIEPGSDPAQPDDVSTISFEGNVQNVAVDDDNIYVAIQSTGESPDRVWFVPRE